MRKCADLLNLKFVYTRMSAVFESRYNFYYIMLLARMYSDFCVCKAKLDSFLNSNCKYVFFLLSKSTARAAVKIVCMDDDTFSFSFNI